MESDTQSQGILEIDAEITNRRTTYEWSRRINDEHRLIYEYNDGNLSSVSCRHHLGQLGLVFLPKTRI